MKVPTQNIILGRPRHDRLPDSLVERITAFKAKLGEMDPIPLDKTIENFRCDRNPEREVEIWEEVADLYVKYVEAHGTAQPVEYKKEVYRTLLSASMCSVDEDFLGSLTHISRDEAIYLSMFFQNKKPITVTRQRGGA